MHGLVLVNRKFQPIRPSIIWCDSRAVEIGKKAFSDIGQKKCLFTLLNSPGNFTASKLKWVMENEPEIYKNIYKAILPGDFVIMKMTGIINTTPCSLSEGAIWDFHNNKIAEIILDHYGISHEIIPDIIPNFSIQGELTSEAAKELGLTKGTKITYRAGDQPNNAFSLNVLNPGEAATTAGTSGVIYGVIDQPTYDSESRVNTFLHINHSNKYPRYGVLLCISGCGILYSWLKNKILYANQRNISYVLMDKLASQSPPGSEGLMVFPFGNGAERILENYNIGTIIQNLDFNIHDNRHLLRASQEGIIFALKYGLDIIRDMGFDIKTLKAGKSNLFLSTLFQEIFSTITKTQLELYETDSSQGAARGAGVGAKIYQTLDNAFEGFKIASIVCPNKKLEGVYQDIYHQWVSLLNKFIKSKNSLYPDYSNQRINPFLIKYHSFNLIGFIETFYVRFIKYFLNTLIPDGKNKLRMIKIIRINEIGRVKKIR